MVSYNPSMQYTIGTALDRARERGNVVEVLADGQWLRGMVIANDGTGVLIEDGPDDHAIIRLDTIAAVRVRAAVQTVPRSAAGAADAASGASRTSANAYSMPAPREPSR